MSRVAVGAVTLQDVFDGHHPITVALSNQSHAFVADSAGAVPSGVQAAFTCEIMAFVGTTRAAHHDTIAEPNTYRVGTLTYSASGWDITKAEANDTQTTFSMATIPPDSTNTSCTVTVPVNVTNSLGNNTDVDVILTLTKIMEGTDGVGIYLEPTRQTFRYDESNNTTDGNIDIDIGTVGNIGTLGLQYLLNGTGGWQPVVEGPGAQQVETITTTGGVPSSLTISSDNFAAANTFSIKVADSGGSSDVVSIVRIQDGSTGAAGEDALFVSITSSDGGITFRNNTGANKILTCTVYDGAVNASASSAYDITYVWYDTSDNSVVTPVSSTDPHQISVGPDNVPDNGSKGYECVVTVTRV